MLEQAYTVNQQVGQRIVISGVEKIGKTTLACSAPNALLIQLEAGAASVPCAKLPMLTEWRAVENLCNEMIAAAKSGRMPRGSTTVWDTATALERIINNEVLNCDPDKGKIKPGSHNMETAHGGYGKGYAVANQLFERWTRYMDELSQYGGINVVVTCHVFAAKVVDPAYGEYDTWDLQLHSPKNLKSYGKREFITQWADMIGFIHEPLFVMKEEKGSRLVRGVDGNQGRMLAVDRSPAWVAGNRYGLSGVIPLPKPEQGKLAVQAWNNLAWSIHNSTGFDLFNRTT